MKKRLLYIPAVICLVCLAGCTGKPAAQEALYDAPLPEEQAAPPTTLKEEPKDDSATEQEPQKAVLPTESEQPPEKNSFVLMVMLDGRIYQDTGETSSIGRCGNMDFSFDKSVEVGTPTENNMTNFGIGYGGQYGMRENCIDICIDGVYHIFAYNENNLDGVTMRVTDNTEHSLTLEIQNDGNVSVQLGDPFSLEYFDRTTDTWLPVPQLADLAFHDIGYEVKEGGMGTWPVDWSALYGALEEGTYRIVKTVWLSQNAGQGEPYTLTAAFEIPAAP